MSHRQTVEFLRRRYAVAILRADADTASRLRVQLDGVLNDAESAGRRAEPQAERQGVPAADRADRASQAGSAAADPGVDRPAPALRLVMPVTGLLEGPGRRRTRRRRTAPQDLGTGTP